MRTYAFLQLAMQTCFAARRFRRQRNRENRRGVTALAITIAIAGKIDFTAALKSPAGGKLIATIDVKAVTASIAWKVHRVYSSFFFY